MSRNTGLSLKNDTEHIQQSIQDILTTPIGTRIMRREYGSLLTQMIDAPMNDVTRLQLYAAAATALVQWEDRINIESIQIEQIESGSFILDLNIKIIDNNKNESLSIPLNFGAVA